MLTCSSRLQRTLSPGFAFFSACSEEELLAELIDAGRPRPDQNHKSEGPVGRLPLVLLNLRSGTGSVHSAGYPGRASCSLGFVV